MQWAVTLPVGIPVQKHQYSMPLQHHSTLMHKTGVKRSRNYCPNTWQYRIEAKDIFCAQVFTGILILMKQCSQGSDDLCSVASSGFASSFYTATCYKSAMCHTANVYKFRLQTLLSSQQHSDQVRLALR